MLINFKFTAFRMGANSRLGAYSNKCSTGNDSNKTLLNEFVIKNQMESKGKVKSADLAGAYPCFCRIKRLRVFLLPPGWDASPSHGYPKHYISQYSFLHLDGERDTE